MKEHKHKWKHIDILRFVNSVFSMQVCECGEVRLVLFKEHLTK